MLGNRQNYITFSGCLDFITRLKDNLDFQKNSNNPGREMKKGKVLKTRGC